MKTTIDCFIILGIHYNKKCIKISRNIISFNTFITRLLFISWFKFLNPPDKEFNTVIE